MMIKKHEDFDKAIGNQEVSHIVSQFTCIDVEVFQLITGKNIGFTFLPMLIERKRVKSYRSITLSFSQVRKHSSFTSILCQIFILKCRHQFFNSLILDYWQCFVCGFVLDPNSMVFLIRIRIRNTDLDTGPFKTEKMFREYKLFSNYCTVKKRALVIWKIIFYTITLSILKKGENLNPIWIRYGSTALLHHFLTIQQQTFFSSDRLKKKRGSGSVQKRTRIRNTD